MASKGPEMSSDGALHAPDDEPPGDGGPLEAAHFIMRALEDLGRLARRHRHEMLVYLIDMTHLETEEILRRGSRRRPSGG